MEHIFKTDENHRYIPYPQSKEAEEALAEGTFYVKIDGSNGCLFREEDGKWTLYSRYDDKKGRFTNTDLPNTIRELPEGKNSSKYQSNEQTHSYYYVLRPRPSEDQRGKLAKIDRELYRIIDSNREYLDSLECKFITVELVGQKFGKTLGVEADCDIAIHSDQKILIFDRSFYGIRETCTDFFIEGLVVEHRGKWWKVRWDGFEGCSYNIKGQTRVLPCLLSKNRQSPNPVESPPPPQEGKSC